ncbi:MAG: hypothetical protein M3O22_08010 [Pseudomonadota bacterium]|nr:hypothetical protein [Pseudomonadota bacterium]
MTTAVYSRICLAVPVRQADQQPPESFSRDKDTIAPEFNPEKWTAYPLLLEFATAYAHAVNFRDPCPFRLQPGQLAGCDPDSLDPKYRNPSRAAVLAVCDGLTYTGNILRRDKGTYPVALFFSKLHDMPLWVRENADGTWSLKIPGHAPEILCDAEGKYIRNISRVRIRLWPDDLNMEFTFSGFFNVPRAGLTFQRDPPPAPSGQVVPVNQGLRLVL